MIQIKIRFPGRFPGVWYHGDYCVLCSRTGGVLMLGRSDGVLNPNGVRFGSAEIYKIGWYSNSIYYRNRSCIITVLKLRNNKEYVPIAEIYKMGQYLSELEKLMKFSN